jgi:hypothetical protein
MRATRGAGLPAGAALAAVLSLAGCARDYGYGTYGYGYGSEYPAYAYPEYGYGYPYSPGFVGIFGGGGFFHPDHDVEHHEHPPMTSSTMSTLLTNSSIMGLPAISGILRSVRSILPVLLRRCMLQVLPRGQQFTRRISVGTSPLLSSRTLGIEGGQCSSASRSVASRQARSRLMSMLRG